ncbi:MAG: PEGA domain-containing protein [Planctomycetes bacterium]|nr:PEGA domain-containing protein [Planctomycetota bacterium]
MKRCAVIVSCLILLLPAAALGAGGGAVGGLFVATEPAGAAVYLDGQLMGVTPCGIPDAPVGVLEVRTAKQGYRPVVEKVEIKAGKTRGLRLSLATLKQVGSLIVLVEPPGAQVAIDQTPRGRTPAVFLNVPAGTHSVAIGAEGLLTRRATVKIAPGEQRVLKGRLKGPEQGRVTGKAGLDLSDLEGVVQRKALLPSDLPEEQMLAPVRQLVRARRYDDALAGLAGLESRLEKGEFALARAREHRMILSARELAQAALARLKGQIGSEVKLMVKGGLPIRGRLVQVGERELRIETNGRETSIKLERLSAEQIVELASDKFDPKEPGNRLRFAAFYAAEGRFEKSYEELSAAAGLGAEPTSTLSYVRSNQLWAAALERASGAVAASMAANHELTTPVRMLVDVRHGTWPDKLAGALGKDDFQVKRLHGVLSAHDWKGADLLVICDPGPKQWSPPYDRREVQCVMDYLREGGGLLFVGARRPADVSQPFAPLLKWCGVQVLSERLEVAGDAPQSYPGEVHPAFPVPGAPLALVGGLRQALFPRNVCALSIDAARAVPLMALSSFVGVGSDGPISPAVVAVGAYGKGRFVVFAAAPVLAEGGDGAALLRSAAVWAARGIH